MKPSDLTGEDLRIALEIQGSHACTLVGTAGPKFFALRSGPMGVECGSGADASLFLWLHEVKDKAAADRWVAMAMSMAEAKACETYDGTDC